MCKLAPLGPPTYPSTRPCAACGLVSPLELAGVASAALADAVHCSERSRLSGDLQPGDTKAERGREGGRNIALHCSTSQLYYCREGGETRTTTISVSSENSS